MQLLVPLPRPRLVDGTFPEYGSNISLAEYAKRMNRICVGFSGQPVLEYSNEGLRGEDYMERSSLIIDGVEWKQTKPSVLADLLMAGAAPYDYDPDTATFKFDPKTGEYFGPSNAIGPFLTCWPDVHLERGDHLLEFWIQSTSGKELGYRWNFSITK